MPLINPNPPVDNRTPTKVLADRIRDTLASQHARITRMFDEMNDVLTFRNGAERTAVLADFGADGPSVTLYRNRLRAAVELLDGQSRTDT
jgi:hypothetical protein